MKFKGKVINKSRLKWWFIIILTKIFGRRVEVLGSEKREKILPIIWNKRLYLLGMQHYGARVIFDSKYRTKIVEAPFCQPIMHPGQQSLSLEPKRGFCHVISMHYPAQEAQRLLDIWQLLAGSENQIILAYGGDIKEFDTIDWDCKFFVPQSEIWPVSVGGVVSYTYLIREAARICIEKQYDGMLYSDSDAWPCADNYLNTLCLPPWQKGFDFSAIKLRDVTHTSYHFNETQNHTIPKLEKWVRDNHFEDPNTPVRILTHFGALKYFSSSILKHFVARCGNEPPIHDEMALSTYMHYLDASYCTYEDFGVFDIDRWFRFRPNLTESRLLEAIQLGVPMVHPVKNNILIHHLDEIECATAAWKSSVKR